MKINKKEIGARIKAARVEAGLQQNDLAKKAGLAQSTLSEIISGSRVTSVENLAKIANALELTLDYLIIGKESPAKTPAPTTAETLVLAITSDAATLEEVQDKLLHRVSEKTPCYQPGLSDEEQRLIDAYHFASEEIREEALGMLVRSAERSGGRGGGTKGLKQSNGE